MLHRVPVNAEIQPQTKFMHIFKIYTVITSSSTLACSVPGLALMGACIPVNRQLYQYPGLHLWAHAYRSIGSSISTQAYTDGSMHTGQSAALSEHPGLHSWAHTYRSIGSSISTQARAYTHGSTHTGQSAAPSVPEPGLTLMGAYIPVNRQLYQYPGQGLRSWAHAYRSIGSSISTRARAYTHGSIHTGQSAALSIPRPGLTLMGAYIPVDRQLYQ